MENSQKEVCDPMQRIPKWHTMFKLFELNSKNCQSFYFGCISINILTWKLLIVDLKEIPCQILACCSCQSQIYMHSIVPLLICLTSLVAFPMLNLPLTIFSMCPGISEGQTFAIF